MTMMFMNHSLSLDFDDVQADSGTVEIVLVRLPVSADQILHATDDH